MHKDIIYIDTEDDITAIIGKIKASKDKIIALVPPKRAGVLQSAVNLRLLARAADKAEKHLVIITNDRALSALTASAKIPIAKNLQSKPEVMEIPALEIDDGDDIIEGSELPVGELMKTADKASGDDIVEVMHDINIDGESAGNMEEAEPGEVVSRKPVEKSKIKVPDFSRFRKKLFLGITGAVIIGGFLVWAIIYAPFATVIITAKTQAASVSIPLTLGGTQASDISKNIIQSMSKTLEKNITVDFTATGKKDVGTKATGTIVLSYSKDGLDQDVPAGSIFSSGDYDFVITAGVTVPGATVVNGHVAPGTIQANIIAAEVGSAYNLSAGAFTSSVSDISGTASATTGGESHQATVVSQDDYDKAKTALNAITNLSIKNQLKAQFVNSEVVIDGSFTATYGDYVSSPLVDAESTTGKATLTSKTTFTITALAKSELESYLRDAITKQISDTKTQKISDDGYSTVKLTNYSKTDSGATVHLGATGKIGPNIDEAQLKQQVKGKGYGDVQALLEGKDGINSVDIKFSYFWVMNVPSDINKIDIQFVLQNG